MENHFWQTIQRMWFVFFWLICFLRSEIQGEYQPKEKLVSQEQASTCRLNETILLPQEQFHWAE
jgi:hypothetical protein